jgi:hypothetical protein
MTDLFSQGGQVLFRFRYERIFGIPCVSCQNGRNHAVSDFLDDEAWKMLLLQYAGFITFLQSREDAADSA